jgi:hypothetical protein
MKNSQVKYEHEINLYIRYMVLCSVIDMNKGKTGLIVITANHLHGRASKACQ